MKYAIQGTDRFGQTDNYGIFNTLKECLTYLNKLKTGCLGSTVRFKYKEISDE